MLDLSACMLEVGLLLQCNCPEGPLLLHTAAGTSCVYKDLPVDALSSETCPSLHTAFSELLARAGCA